jgi:hypothetical protein
LSFVLARIPLGTIRAQYLVDLDSNGFNERGNMRGFCPQGMGQLAPVLEHFYGTPQFRVIGS